MEGYGTVMGGRPTSAGEPFRLALKDIDVSVSLSLSQIAVNADDAPVPVRHHHIPPYLPFGLGRHGLLHQQASDVRVAVAVDDHVGLGGHPAAGQQGHEQQAQAPPYCSLIQVSHSLNFQELKELKELRELKTIDFICPALRPLLR